MTQYNRRPSDKPNHHLFPSGHDDTKPLGLSSAPVPPLDPQVAEILDYLKHNFSAYPFDPKLDTDFIIELASDFDRFDLLEQIKTFRWYYDDDLSRIGNPRAALRRWMARARERFV